jgi:hypothetical protein
MRVSAVRNPTPSTFIAPLDVNLAGLLLGPSLSKSLNAALSGVHPVAPTIALMLGMSDSGNRCLRKRLLAPTI